MVVNKRLFWKRKIRWYITPMKVKNLSSFEKKKEYVLALSKTIDQKVDGYKETDNI